MTTPALAYGRKSFDDPDRRTSSVQDQHDAATTYAERNGFQLVGYHGDDGITGATMDRPGLKALLAAMVAGVAKIVIIEDIDRLSRDQEHLQHMGKLFALHQVVLHTVAAGPLPKLVFDIKGMIGEQQRARIAYTTRRGLKGKANRGGATGGKTLGYVREVLEQGSDGKVIDRLAIHPPGAELVRRIFKLFADGHSLKQICKILNAEAIPSPRARERGKYNSGVWNPTTLSGDPAMGEGILNNELYVGRRIFNRRTWVEVPDGKQGIKRRPRLNPQSEWIVREEPELRIIEDAVWQRVKERQAQARAARDAKFKINENPLAGAKRPVHLLSGLVTCGSCEQPFLATGGGRWRCKAHRQQACSNGSITSAELEARVLAGIRDRLLTPEIIDRFAAQLQRELDAGDRERRAGHAKVDAELQNVRQRIAKLVRQFEEEEDIPRTLTARLRDLETEEDRLTDELSKLQAPKTVRLPANYEAVYRRAVADLESHLASASGGEAREAVRSLNREGGRTAWHGARRQAPRGAASWRSVQHA